MLYIAYCVRANLADWWESDVCGIGIEETVTSHQRLMASLKAIVFWTFYAASFIAVLL